MRVDPNIIIEKLEDAKRSGDTAQLSQLLNQLADVDSPELKSIFDAFSTDFTNVPDRVARDNASNTRNPIFTELAFQDAEPPEGLLEEYEAAAVDSTAKSEAREKAEAAFQKFFDLTKIPLEVPDEDASVEEIEKFAKHVDNLWSSLIETSERPVVEDIEEQVKNHPQSAEIERLANQFQNMAEDIKNGTGDIGQLTDLFSQIQDPEIGNRVFDLVRFRMDDVWDHIVRNLREARLRDERKWAIVTANKSTTLAASVR